MLVAEFGIPFDDADLMAESFFVCERCVDGVIGTRRYVGIGAGGVLIFAGLLVFVNAYDAGRALGLALALAGIVWSAWALLDTHDARDDAAVRIAKEESQSAKPGRYWTPDEYEADFGRKPTADLPRRGLPDR